MSAIDYFQVNESDREKIWKTYGKDQKSRAQDVTILKEWMQTQPHLPEILDNNSLENFFLLSKCSFEKAKKCIDMYYTIRPKIPCIFENLLNNEKVEKACNIVHFFTLPKATKEGYRVFAVKIQKPELLEDLSPDDVFMFLFKIQEMRLKEDVMFGDVLIYDLKDISLSFMKKLTPTYILTVLMIYEKVFAIPLKAVYVINSPSYVKYILAILKTIMKPKVYARILVSEDDSLLKTHLDFKILPEDFGGDEESLNVLSEKLRLNLKKYEARFESIQKLRVIEDLRPEKLENDEWGFHGNFKQLDFD